MGNDAGNAPLDEEENRKTYEAVMGFSSEVGVPFSLALTMFFVMLVMANGWLMGLIAGAATYLFAYFVVKAFFSH